MSSSLIPSDNRQYNSVDYWDKRYESCGQSESQSYDWLVNYSNVKHIIEECVPKTASVLMLGCGNSLLSEEMFANGYKQIHNIDYSSEVIKQMSNHCVNCSQMDWSVMDCSDLKFDDNSFDVVLEKATIDALLTGEQNPWDISQQSRDQLTKVFNEVQRVLKPEGQFISISFYAPHFRYPLYKSSIGSIVSENKQNQCTGQLQMKAVHELSANFHYYCYQLIKSPEKTIEFEPNVYEPPKQIISGLDINQNSNNSDNNTTDETRVQENHNYIFDINL